jgi:hypothetical protein
VSTKLRSFVASIALVAALSLALSACGSTTIVQAPPSSSTSSPTSSASTAYPPAFASKFLTGCESGTATTVGFCKCTLAYLEAHDSLSTVVSYVPGSKPAWLLQASAACITKLATGSAS